MINKMPIKFFEARIIQNSKELQELEDEFNAFEYKVDDIETVFTTTFDAGAGLKKLYDMVSLQVKV